MDSEPKVRENREYEITILTVNETDEVSLSEGMEILKKDGPKLVSLAYPIKDHTSAALWVYIARCASEVAATLNHTLQSNSLVLRHLVITPPIVASRRAPQPVASEKPAPAALAEQTLPSRPDTVTNEALEKALEKILENESQ